MFEFLKDKKGEPPALPEARCGGAIPSRPGAGRGLPLPGPVCGPEPGADRLGGKRGRRSVTLEVQGDPSNS